jgi:hypothetical protein
MKTLGRVLIILAVFSILAGLMVTIVNASGMNQPNFDSDGAQTEFRPSNDSEGGLPFPSEEERTERGDFVGSRWAFGLIKNVGVIAVLVAVIVWPRNAMKRKRKMSAIGPADEK